MKEFRPEGHRITAAENRAAMQTPSALAEAQKNRRLLEARAIVCDGAHNLIVDLGCMRGINRPRDSYAPPPLIQAPKDAFR